MGRCTIKVLGKLDVDELLDTSERLNVTKNETSKFHAERAVLTF